MRTRRKMLLVVLSVCLFLGSTLMVQAAGQQCPPHNFIKETYSHTNYTNAAHSYVWGYLEDRTPLYKTCNYQKRTIVLNMVCCYCDTDSGVDKTTSASDIGHVCGQ
ncbi:MAG: hypothetical protein UFG06_12435 [Lachnospiraceae bacterium]|nr:hypothetical protein [Lachnospiraceae bacterium]